MKIKLRGDIYTPVPAIITKACKGCAFLHWEQGICTAPISIYRVICTQPNEIWQYSNTHFDIFNL